MPNCVWSPDGQVLRDLGSQTGLQVARKGKILENALSPLMIFQDTSGKAVQQRKAVQEDA